jgi:hypothetical protein
MKNSILRSGLLIICFIVSGFYAMAQDTIFYKKTGSIVVIVKEVSQTEVQYKKLEMPDGPMYIISKNDIAKIVYKNGYTEEIKDPVSEPVNTASQPFTVTYSSPISTGPEKISYEDTKRRPRSLLSLIDRHPNAERKPALMGTYGSIKRLKAGQDATRTVAIVFGGVTIAAAAITGLVYMIDSYAASEIVPFPIAFGSVALISTAASVAFNINLRKKRHAFVDLYNQ